MSKQQQDWSLQPGEEVVWRTAPFLGREIKFWLILAIPTVTIGAFVAFFTWLSNRLTRPEYVLTNRRLIHASGWINRRAQNVALTNLQEVNYRRNLIESRVYGTGTMAVESSATLGVMAFRRVADDDPLLQRVQQHLYGEAEAASAETVS